MTVENKITEKVQPFARSVERRMIDEMGLEPMEKFAHLLDLKNLQGESTGYVKTLSGDRIDRATSLSIAVAPGMRYFNIHIMPDHHYEVPRYSFEGMITPHGSQVSMDLYPDFDVVTNLDKFEQMYAGVHTLFEAAKNTDKLPLEFSRIPHMRAIASPYFILVPRTSEDQMPVLERYANAYFDEWLKLFRQAEKLTGEEAAAKLSLRNLIGQIIVERDPDRHMVVQVYGEETIQAIEAAAMP
jgi:hypothetical protein